ncbi:MAG: hypothetical protein K2O39_05515, partial [Clostridiales bacterium]|nr:hypothetical protein [Clostridiales bacterium]
MMFTTYKKRGLILLSVIIAALLCLVGGFMLSPQKTAAIAEDGDPLLPDTHAHTNAYTGGDMEDDGSYYLNGNATGGITVTGNVTLCLNGNIFYSVGTVPVITVEDGGTLTLCDCQGTGMITAGNALDGGGVLVETGGTLIMMGGTISGNTADFGGGVYVKTGGTFNMMGGTITDNTANYDGGGVYVDNGSVFQVSGAVNITDNNGKDVYLGGDNTIAVTGALYGGAKIGVTFDAAHSNTIATGFMQDGRPSEYFILDDPDDCLYVSTTTGAVTICEHDWQDALTVDDADHWYACTRCDRRKDSSPHGYEFGNYAGVACDYCGYTAYFEVTANNVKSYYKTIEAAFASVTDDATVKMLADAVTTDTLTVGTYSSQNVTLDLNGCMLKYNNDDEHNPVITVACNFTLIDSNTDTTKKHSIPDPDNAGETIEVIGGLVTGGTGYYIFDHGEHSRGGGVYVTNGSTFTMTGGTISGNTAEDGGGVY